MMRVLFILLCLLLNVPSWAAPTRAVEMGLTTEAQNHARFTLDLSAPVMHSIFTLSAPHRLVIDLKNTQLTGTLIRPPSSQLLIDNIRSAPREGDLRVVFDLKVPVRIKSFSTKTISGQRLVVEMSASPKLLGFPSKAVPATVKPVSSTEKSQPSEKTDADTKKQLAPIFPSLSAVNPVASPEPEVLPSKSTAATNLPTGSRELVIAVDAGHGGIDSGAVGKNGSLEKDIVLSIAKELATLISQERGMRAVLIRKDDYFLKLRKRIELARDYRADLFVSIHADTYPGSDNARGASVYMLSQAGASSEAANWLANKENAADLLGGVSLSDKDDLLASVLLDLSQTGTLESSARLGERILKSLDQIDASHYSHVQQAAFMVLRSPDIPSVLVETGFISTPGEEEKLNSTLYRKQLAAAVFEGIKNYLNTYPTETLIARR